MDDDWPAVFEAVYRDTYQQITAYAVRRCDSPQDAADVVAETFTVAWRRIHDLPPGDQARPWLYGVARRVLADHYRSAARRSRNVELVAELAAYYPDPTDGVVGVSAIGKVFRALSGDDRELLSLVAWEGLGTEEIAIAMGVSRNAVRVRLHRARKRFARALDAADIRFDTESRMVPAGRSL